MGHRSLTHSSPRVSSEELASPFPAIVDSGSSHETVTMEELLVLDGIRRALRVVEQLLQGRLFFGGSRADVIDAVVFAHLAILFSLPLPGMRRGTHWLL